MKISMEELAKLCHEVNKSYCEAIGDNSQVSWELAEDWQQDAAFKGVNHHLNNPDSKVSDSHNQWMQDKIDDGWVYGVEKNGDLKTHPCIVPYEDLPNEQKAKDYIFKAIVDTVRSMIDNSAAD